MEEEKVKEILDWLTPKEIKDIEVFRISKLLSLIHQRFCSHSQTIT